MIKKYTIVLFSVLLLLSSCNTYINFYSTTHYKTDTNQISKIHRLDLSHQNLSVLPASVAQIKSLRMINLSNNPKLILDSVFDKLSIHKNLEILILDSLQITTLPKNIKKLSHLKQLSLAYNPKIDLKHTIDQISSLPIIFLNLKGNGIEQLPNTITKLTTIKDLNLSYNSIKDPASYSYLGALPKLYSLWIDHNTLNELPHTIGNLDQVRFLYIDHNKLDHLPKEIEKMRKVWVIHAGYNNFKEFPERFIAMKSLLMVHINNNQIQKIPEAYSTKKYSLSGLLLDNNPILPEEKKKAKKLFKSFFLLSFEQKAYK